MLNSLRVRIAMNDTKTPPKVTINFDKIPEVKVKIDVYHPGTHREKLEKGYKGFKLKKRHVTK